SGTFARELLTLEPLLDEYDGIEIAAAALQLLEHRRATTSHAGAVDAPRAAARSTAGAGTGTTRLFVNVGAKDNAKAGDFVGAIVPMSAAVIGVRRDAMTADRAARFAREDATAVSARRSALVRGAVKGAVKAAANEAIDVTIGPAPGAAGSRVRAGASRGGSA